MTNVQNEVNNEYIKEKTKSTKSTKSRYYVQNDVNNEYIEEKPKPQSYVQNDVNNEYIEEETNSRCFMNSCFTNSRFTNSCFANPCLANSCFTNSCFANSCFTNLHFKNLCPELYNPNAWASLFYLVFWFLPWSLFCFVWVACTGSISVVLSLVLPPLGYFFCIATVVSWRYCIIYHKF
jgi:hypothetical protein